MRVIYMSDLLLLVPLLVLAGAMAANAQSSDPRADLAPFGWCYHYKEHGEKGDYTRLPTDLDDSTLAEVAQETYIGVEWDHPREVSAVQISGPLLPDVEDIRAEYYDSIWPNNGTGGWQRLDDPYTGRWVAADTKAKVEGDTITLSFEPLTKHENPRVEHTGFSYRRTFKVRLFFRTPAKVASFSAISPESTTKQAEITVEWKPSEKNAEWTGDVEVRNGYLASCEKTSDKTLDISLSYTDNPDRLSADRGYIVFRAGGTDSFSVFVDDIVREGAVYVRDIDAFLSIKEKGLAYADWEKPADAWDKTVMGKVAELPEQTLEQVMKAIPPKPLKEGILGVANMRQEFCVSGEGEIFLYHNSLRCPASDWLKRTWKDYMRVFSIATGTINATDNADDRKATRNLVDNYRPVLETRWSAEGIEFSKSAFATLLCSPITEAEKMKGDEPLVLCEKITLSNKSDKPETAVYDMRLFGEGKIEDNGLITLAKSDDGVYRKDMRPIYGRFDISGNGSLDILQKDKDRFVRYSVELAPGEEHTAYFYCTYIELLSASEVDALLGTSYEKEYAPVMAWWDKIIGSGMSYEVPEPWLNDLFKANVWHNYVTTDLDPFTGLHQHGAATFVYFVYANETGMVAQSMEMRGDHDGAFELLEPFLVSQSHKALPGNFNAAEGVLYAAFPTKDKDPYTAQGYNMHHGWALWNLCEHYLYTRDREYLENISEALIKACDWIIGQRKLTMEHNPDGTKRISYGLAPAGDLEDVEEYLYWYATNGYYYIGLKKAAECLSEIGHPEAARLTDAASAYHLDILASLSEAVTTAPVVKLRDGTYVPYIPPRAYVMTHLKEGWIREGLYPALHLVDCEVLPPEHPYVTWMLEDLEDNIFLSKESGYGVEDVKSNFFDFGGFNPQPNLLPNAQAHLLRGEVPHFIRVFYNMFWASYWTDIVCFTEWVPYYGKYGGPLYKTPDESKFIQYMRNMLVCEHNDDLLFGWGVPRDWMQDGKTCKITDASTYFGNCSLTIESRVSAGEIAAKVEMSDSYPPKHAYLRLRHPEAKKWKSVTVGGMPWDDVDSEQETIKLPVTSDEINVVVTY